MGGSGLGRSHSRVLSLATLIALPLGDPFLRAHADVIGPANAKGLTGKAVLSPCRVVDSDDTVGRLAIGSRCHVNTVASAYARRPLIASAQRVGSGSGGSNNSRLRHVHKTTLNDDESGSVLHMHMEIPEPRPIDTSGPPRTWVHPDDVRPLFSQVPAGILYRFYDADLELLYIGVTSGCDPIHRWRGHRAESKWWPLVAHYSIARFHKYWDTRAEIEKSAIQAERPRSNKQHTKSLSTFTVRASEGPESIVEQFRKALLPVDFAALAAAFAAQIEP